MYRRSNSNIDCIIEVRYGYDTDLMNDNEVEEIMDKMQSTDNKNDDNIYWEDKPTIIVVDDNEDMINFLSASCFCTQF